jgi:hypothetical protein
MRSLTLQLVVAVTAFSTFINDVDCNNLISTFANANEPSLSEVHTFALGAQIGVACKAKKRQNVEIVESTERAENCGEDAYFVSANGRNAESKYISFGIADGVGGWIESGGQPSAFSKALCTGARHSFIEAVNPHPLNMMKEGYEHVLKGGDKNAGGSTAVFLVMDRFTGHLETANLGDSGYLIIRNGKIIYEPRTNYKLQFSISAVSVTIIHEKSRCNRTV